MNYRYLSGFLSLGRICTVVDPGFLVRLVFHFEVILVLVFVELGLVDARFGVEPVLVKVTLSVKLLVDVGGFH